MSDRLKRATTRCARSQACSSACCAPNKLCIYKQDRQRREAPTALLGEMLAQSFNIRPVQHRLSPRMHPLCACLAIGVLTSYVNYIHAYLLYDRTSAPARNSRPLPTAQCGRARCLLLRACAATEAIHAAPVLQSFTSGAAADNNATRTMADRPPRRVIAERGILHFQAATSLQLLRGCSLFFVVYYRVCFSVAAHGARPPHSPHTA